MRYAILVSTTIFTLIACGGGDDDNEPLLKVHVSNLESSFTLNVDSLESFEITKNGETILRPSVDSSTNYSIEIASQPASPSQYCSVVDEDTPSESPEVKQISIHCISVPSQPEITAQFATKKIAYDWSEAGEDVTYNFRYENQATLPADSQPHHITSTGSSYKVNATGESSDESISTSDTSINTYISLYEYTEASVSVEACNLAGCSQPGVYELEENLNNAVGFFKSENPDRYDFLGEHVAVSKNGKTIFATSPGDDSSYTENGSMNNDVVDSGAVYVYELNEDNDWYQSSFIKARDAVSGDSFGNDVAINSDGSLLAVSAHMSDSANYDENVGSVYIFEKTEDGWFQKQKIQVSEVITSRFGNSLALDDTGQVLVVASSENNGTVRIYRADDTGMYTDSPQVLAAPDLNETNFGNSIALSGDANVLVVGASLAGKVTVTHDDEEGLSEDFYEGRAYIYELDESAWVLTTELEAPNPRLDGYFGTEVAVSSDGTTIGIGEPGGAIQPGIAHILRKNNEVWSYDGSLSEEENSYEDDDYGRSIAIDSSGNLILIGAKAEDSSSTGISSAISWDGLVPESGAVYLYSIESDVKRLAYIKAKQSGPGDFFGEDVALSDDGTIVISASNESSASTGINDEVTDNSLRHAGAIYVY